MLGVESSEQQKLPIDYGTTQVLTYDLDLD